MDLGQLILQLDKQPSNTDSDKRTITSPMSFAFLRSGIQRNLAAVGITAAEDLTWKVDSELLKIMGIAPPLVSTVEA